MKIVQLMNGDFINFEKFREITFDSGKGEEINTFYSYIILDDGEKKDFIDLFGIEKVEDIHKVFFISLRIISEAASIVIYDYLEYATWKIMKDLNHPWVDDYYFHVNRNNA